MKGQQNASEKRPVVERALELDGSDEYSRRDLVYDGTTGGGRGRAQRVYGTVERTFVVEWSTTWTSSESVRYS